METGKYALSASGSDGQLSERGRKAKHYHSCLDRNRLYVGIYQTEYGYPELFSDLTVNLHHAPLNGVNEAYIDHNFSKEHLRFIRKYKLGRVLPETVASGYCTFQKVAFDLKKLAEYDPQGTREFMESHGIQIADAPKQKPKNKSQRER